MCNQRSSLLRRETKLCGGRLHVDIKERWNEARGTAETQLERGETGRCVDSVHELQTNVRLCTDPPVLLTGDVVSQHLDNGAICPLTCTVSLRVVCGGELDLNASKSVQRLPEARHK